MASFWKEDKILNKMNAFFFSLTQAVHHEHEMKLKIYFFMKISRNLAVKRLTRENHKCCKIAAFQKHSIII